MTTMARVLRSMRFSNWSRSASQPLSGSRLYCRSSTPCGFISVAYSGNPGLYTIIIIIIRSEGRRVGGPGDEDVVAGVGEDFDGELEGVGAAGGEDDVVGVHGGVRVGGVFGDGLADVGQADGGPVAVESAGGGGLLEGPEDDGVGGEGAGDGGIADVELDEGLVGVGLDGHDVDDAADGVDGVDGVLGGRDPTPAALPAPRLPRFPHARPVVVHIHLP